MLRRMSAILTAVLCCASVLLCAGCESREDKEKKSFIPLAQALIQGGVDICTNVYLGGGMEAQIPEDVVPDTENGAYYPIVSDRYGSISQMKRDAELVFTEELAQSWLYAYAFDGERPLYKEQDGVVVVNVGNEKNYAYGIDWLYDTISVDELSDVHAVVTIDTQIGDERHEVKTVEYVKTADGWRINSPLFDTSKAGSQSISSADVS